MNIVILAIIQPAGYAKATAKKLPTKIFEITKRYTCLKNTNEESKITIGALVFPAPRSAPA